MKMILSILFLFNMLAGLSQDLVPSQFKKDFIGFNHFKQDFSDYYESIKRDGGNFFTESYEFKELPNSFDSLEQLGYRLKYINAEHDFSDGYYERISNDSSLLDVSEMQFLLDEINRLCATGVYNGGLVGDKYFIFHSSKPTGLIREVTYYFIKE